MLFLSSCATSVRVPVAEGLVIQGTPDFDIALNKDGYAPKDWPGFVLRGESTENWTLRLGSHTDPEGAGLDPEQYFTTFAKQVSGQCEGIEAYGGKSKERAGSHTAFVGFIYCYKDESTGVGEVAAYRMISGEDAMYIVKMAKRVPPFTRDTKPTDINLEFMETMVRRSEVCKGSKC
jgi:hypothetical protein